MDSHLDADQLTTFRMLMQVRLIETMLSQDQLINPDSISKWNLENHLKLLGDTRIWLKEYVQYFEELNKSGKITDPAFDAWSTAAQDIPMELESAFLPWIETY